MSLSSVFDPPYIPRAMDSDDWYQFRHSAVACNGDCLFDTTHGCSHVISGGVKQCVWWGGMLEAKSHCAAWPECISFWCGPASDVANTTSDSCWARNAASLVGGGPFVNATSYIKSSVPDTVTASCSSASCSWNWASGKFVRSTGVLTLVLDDGRSLKGHVSDNCSRISFSDGRAWSNLNLQIRKVHTVFMAHLDVGYTEYSVQHLIDDYATSWMPKAFLTAKALRARGGQERFAWTSHPWLLTALLENQTGNISPAFVSELEAAIERDDIRWHANPMNMQSEAGERFNMEYGMTIATELDKRFGKPKKIAASQKDEPGATLGMVRMFADAGVQLLHIGVNDFSTVPAFPKNSAFYHSFCNPSMWRDEETGKDSAELMVLYCSGYSGPFEAGVEAPNQMTVLPGHDEALVYLMHVDNSGPQSVEQVLEGWQNIRRTFPNAAVELSTMDEWLKGVLRVRNNLPADALPVVEGKEPGSTWIYGVASEPRKMRWYRAVTRVATEAVRTGSVDPLDPRFREFQRLLLKVPEHTDGPSSGCTGNYTNAQFNDPSYECHIGSAKYQAYIDGIMDQVNFVPVAVRALGALQPLRSNCEKAMKSTTPLAPDVAGLQQFDWTRPVTTAQGLVVRFNESGAIVSLRSGSSAKDHASSLKPLGLFQYATHSEDELNDFGKHYTLGSCSTSCGMCGFSKCNLRDAGAESAHYPARIASAVADLKAGRFVFNLTFPGRELRTKYGAPGSASLEVILSKGSSMYEVVADFELQWFDKPPTRMAESLWMTFNPEGPTREGWEMDKMGRWVDPLAVAVNGSQTMHGIWSGVRHRQAGVLLESPDAPIVMPGNSLAPTGVFNRGDDGMPHPERGWSFNLFNNAWSTNYAFFSTDAAEKFRWRLSFGHQFEASRLFV